MGPKIRTVSLYLGHSRSAQGPASAQPVPSAPLEEGRGGWPALRGGAHGTKKPLPTQGARRASPGALVSCAGNRLPGAQLSRPRHWGNLASIRRFTEHQRSAGPGRPRAPTSPLIYPARRGCFAQAAWAPSRPRTLDVPRQVLGTERRANSCALAPQRDPPWVGRSARSADPGDPAQTQAQRPRQPPRPALPPGPWPRGLAPPSLRGEVPAAGGGAPRLSAGRRCGSRR